MIELSTKRSDYDRRKALDHIPSGLDETYVRDLDKLKKVPADFQIALRALTWLLYSTQPLRLSHLATAAAVDPNCVFSEDQRLDQNENIFDVCKSLILINLETTSWNSIISRFASSWFL